MATSHCAPLALPSPLTQTAATGEATHGFRCVLPPRAEGLSPAPAGRWLVAAVGTAVTMQCHVLGVTLLPVVGALLVADIRRRVAPGERVARSGAAR